MIAGILWGGLKQMNKCGYVKFEVQKNVLLNYIAFQISSEEKQMVH